MSDFNAACSIHTISASAAGRKSAAVLVLSSLLVQEAQVQGVQPHPKYFDLVKMWTESLNVQTKYEEIWAKYA